MKNICAMVLLALTAPLFAQNTAADEDDPAWYQVEVLIFRYLEASGETESWPELPELSYPIPLRHLRPGLPAGDLRQEFVLEQIEDTVPVTGFDLAWEKSAADLLQEYQESVRALAAAEARNGTSPAPGSVFSPDEVTVPRAFVPVAENTTEFRAQALAIRRSRDKRLMYHQSWLQPLRSRERSLSIAVDGVIEAGDYPTLQGSLLLYVSRYLHVETDIWLNTGSTAEVTKVTEVTEDPAIATDHPLPAILPTIARWRMPAPPLPPQPYTWSPWAFQVQLDVGFSDDIDLSNWSRDEPGTYAEPEVYAAQAGNAINQSGAMQAIVAEFDPADILQPIGINAARIPVLDIEQVLAQRWYPFERAVLVKHKRRMRSDEVHYLDHPLLGIILRVSPYEFEAFGPTQELNNSLAGSSPEFRR